MERARKSQISIEQLTTELASERGNAQKMENSKVRIWWIRSFPDPATMSVNMDLAWSEKKNVFQVPFLSITM